MGDDMNVRWNGTAGKIAWTLVGLFQATLVALLMWQSASIVNLKEFAARGDRFTLEQAQAMERRILDQVHKEIPPRWLVERLDRLQSDLQSIVTEQQRLQVQIDRLEGHDPDSYTSDRRRRGNGQ